MKRLSLLLCAALFLAAITCLHAQRDATELASGWKFIKQDVSPTGATDGWDSVTVPHTWNAQDQRLGTKGNPTLKWGYYRGACWYAYPLQAPAEWKAKRVFIRFEAAALVAKVYLNGELLGEHRGGFTAFCYELTPHLHPGAVNDLRVQVDNSQQPDVPPLSGDFNIDGGIYRPVCVIVTDPVCVTPLDFASPGVYLTTKSLTDASAQVEVKSLISNGTSATAKITVQSEITDATGNSVAKTSTHTSLDANQTAPVVQAITLPNPHRWNGRKDPYLYTVTVHVLRDGNEVDQVLQPLGLRTVAITQDQGFLLNGQPYPIYGVNRHQDYGEKGWALSHADHEADAKMILDLGATAIRLTHYPQSDYFHSLCDRNGLLLWNEVSMVNSISDSPEFAANAEQQLRELILQRYNHPAAVFWGMFNELDNAKGPPPAALVRHLKDVIHELDPSRIDVAASSHDKKNYNQTPTGICFNHYPGWYDKALPDGMAKYIDERAAEVGKRIGLSEYGAGANTTQHQEGPLVKVDPKGGYHPEEWQTYVHEVDWGIIKDNPKVWGSFLWVMFDFSSALRHEGGVVGINDKGLVTQDRQTKKDSYFFYKANWNPEPMVYLASRRSTPRTLPTTEVQVFSNCAKVDLTVNGQSLGSAVPDRVHIARWPNVTLKLGPNHIEATATGTSGPLTDACDWELVPPPPAPPAPAPTPTPTKPRMGIRA